VERASQLVSTTLLTRGQSTAILIKLANYSLAPVCSFYVMDVANLSMKYERKSIFYSPNWNEC